MFMCPMLLARPPTKSGPAGPGSARCRSDAEFLRKVPELPGSPPSMNMTAVEAHAEFVHQGGPKVRVQLRLPPVKGEVKKVSKASGMLLLPGLSCGRWSSAR